MMASVRHGDAAADANNTVRADGPFSASLA
jgi:hypothetical protein